MVIPPEFRNAAATASVALAVLLLLPTGCSAPSPRPDPLARTLVTEETGNGPAAKKGEPAMDASLRELVALASRRAVSRLGSPGGYQQSDVAHIPVPDALAPMASALMRAGLGAVVAAFEEDLNVSAEIAMKNLALPVANSVSSAPLRDAGIVLAGDGPGGTAQWRQSAENPLLEAAIRPVADGMRKTGLVDSYRLFVDRYLSLPGSEPVPFDPELYVRSRMIDGLFAQAAEEERAIRAAPRGQGGSDRIEKAIRAAQESW